MQKIPLTTHGAELLKKELDDLKRVQRPAVIKAIAEARAHGDLKENAEYHAAREQQAFIEGRIVDLESKISHAQIIDIKNIQNTGKVIFGATVELVNIETDDQIKYQIVGEDEADIKLGKISIGSPIARAMIGHSIGEVVNVKTPNGEIEYEISTVEHL